MSTSNYEWVRDIDDATNCETAKMVKDLCGVLRGAEPHSLIATAHNNYGEVVLCRANGCDLEYYRAI